MGGILEITYKEIQQLNEDRLTQLLSILLYAEASAVGIPLRCIYVSQKIKVPDGGEDGRANWEAGPESTNWFPTRYCSYQAKATDMSKADCSREVLQKNQTKLKPLVKDVFEAGGTYILFYGRNCGEQQQQKRIKAIRDAIKKTNTIDENLAKIQIYDANKIAAWTSKVAAACVAVCHWAGKPLPWAAQTWADWAGYQEIQRIPYVYGDAKRDGQIRDIRNFFKGPRKVARISGLPGLGKSRLALEALRPPEKPEENPDQQLLSDHVVYLDASTSEDDLAGVIREWRAEGLRGLLIIDNCETRLHRILAREVQHTKSNLSLLTLGVEPCDGPSDDTEAIELVEVEVSVIKQILKQAYTALPDRDIEFIAKELAQGFPQMAVLLADARLENEPDIRKIVNDDLLPRLLRLEGPNAAQAYRVISACAVVTNLGLLNEAENEYKFLANYCGISPDEFYARVQDLLKKRVLVRHGKFVQVRPKPLAMRLAADWWEQCSSDRARSLMESNMPPGFAKALCDRMAMLDFMPEVQGIVKDLCGDQGPFGQVEVLNSEMGSRLFHSLVEVNPDATVNALKRVVERWSKDDLLKIGPSRRNLVWALTKLCFWEQTFVDAARILMRFAASENESWSNNATGEFLDLFRVLLSGTQAPLMTRLILIDEALKSQDMDIQNLGIRALGSALETSHFTKMSGVEQQGSRPPQQDYHPKYWQEIFDYWTAVIGRLTPLACADTDEGKLARGQFAHHIRGLVRYGRLDDLEFALKSITQTRNGFWPEGLNSLQETILYDGKGIPKEGLERIQAWLKWFEPDTLRDKLRLYVVVAPYEHEQNENGQFEDVAAIKAAKFAERIVDDWNKLFKNWDVIFVGGQRQGYIFGQRLGELSSDLPKVIDEALSTLSRVPEKYGNSIVLGGLLAAAHKRDPNLVAAVLDRVAKDDHLVRHLVDLTRCVPIDEKHLDRIGASVQSGRVKPEWLVGLSYGRAIDNVSPERVARFCSMLAGKGVVEAWVAIDTLSMFALGDKAKWEICVPTFREILMIHGMLSQQKINNNFAVHHFQRAALKLLESSDEDLALHLAKEIVSVCSNKKGTYDLDHALVPILNLLLTKFFYQTWPVIGTALLDRGSIASVHLRHLLGDRLGRSESGVISGIPPDNLLAWCEVNKNGGPELLMEILPPLVQEEGKAKLGPLVTELLNRYGMRKQVLSALSVNLGSFSWTGSLVPFYERLEMVMMPLRDHMHSEVREWAIREIKYARQAIKAERMRDEEQQIGRY